MRIEIKIGLSDRDGNLFGPKENQELSSFLDRIADLTGGLEEKDVIGRYKNRQGNIIKEPSKDITIFVLENEKLILKEIRCLIKDFLIQTNQESAILVVDLLNTELIET